ncbi:serine protease inhibitor 42Dd [Drosophila teissieri]|uniref:serine protease inhibitor 42Dd n=1 Tax=Drosophila teissieri TaxID=7243 RepID=UPI001CBA4354|nr:serine protease inhibitor 42Dd [Drosophila teissieri]
MYVLLLILLGISRYKAQKNVQLTDGFYAAIVSSFSNRNIMFSTEMIRSSMLFIYVGVEEAESEQIRKALHYQGTHLSDHKPEAQKIFDMSAQTAPVAKSLTRFFVRQNLKMSTEYRVFMRHTEGRARNIAFNREKLNEVNTLYSHEMGEHIGQVVKESWWKPNSQALLINAIYFNLSWEHTFNPEATYPREFRVNAAKKVMIPMMHEDSKFAFGTLGNLKASAVLVPFSQGDLQMLLIKPDQPDELAHLQVKLSGMDIVSVARNLTMMDVFVGIPKFRLHSDLELTPALEQMGIKDIFKPSKSFSTLLHRNTNFRIDGVIHVVSFEFQEQGIGAPSTDVGNGSLTHTFNGVKYFLATHPFAFYIIDHTSVFFAGHVTSF